MSKEKSIGGFVKKHRLSLGLTQAELANRVGCATITIRKIESDQLRPSIQIAELLAIALDIPFEEQADFVRLARSTRIGSPAPPRVPSSPPLPEEIGTDDLSGRSVRGYELGERIGAGGFGAVYRAIQPGIGREVALKIILPQYANHPEFVRRFEAEAHLVARLEHPHIVPLYDYWREPDAAFLAMRLLRGGSLKNYLKEGPLPLKSIWRILKQIGNALHAAHRSGVIHRDIKPANILLDKDQNAYLADFGIAKNLNDSNLSDLSQTGVLIGSPEYISPEQIQAHPVRPQADIYCLGVVLFEMLVGKSPFAGSTPVDMIVKHLNEALPPLRQLNPSLPEELDRVLERATTKDPTARYPDIPALLAEVREALTHAGGGTIIEPLLQSADVAIDPATIENPFKGLRPFKEADEDDFFGRKPLIQKLLTRMGEENDLARFLAVVGASGSGKSSAVHAGLIPAIRRGALPGSENWFLVDFMPGEHPFEELEAALLRIAVNAPESLLGQLKEDERGLHRAVKRILPPDESVELVIIIDQFEEVFTLVKDKAVRALFLNSLVAAVLDPRSRVRIVVTFRADFMDHPLRYLDFGELIQQRAEYVLPLTSDELELAITGPANKAGLLVEPHLTARIDRDLDDQPGALPLLQYTLTELFERREGRYFTLNAYNEIGGVLGALGRRAEDTYLELDEMGQAIARQLFLRLIALGEGVEDTRRRVLRTELEALFPGQSHFQQEEPWEDKLQQVITSFGKFRLLTFDYDPATRGPTIEVAHEALLREWPRLRGWLDEYRGDVRFQRTLAAAADEWRSSNRHPGFHLRGFRLDQIARWAEETSLALTLDERSFLEASLTERRKREIEEGERQVRERVLEGRSRVFLRSLVGVFAIATIIALVLWNSAQSNFVTSERIRLAAQAQNVLDQGQVGDLPALLALRSLQLGYSKEADAALQNALNRGFSRQQYAGHNDLLINAFFSPDGRFILTSSLDGANRLWNLQTGEELRRFPDHHGPAGALFSPDGQAIFSGGLDGTARLWDLETAAELRRFTHGEVVWAMDISPDNQYALTASGADLYLWNLINTAETQQMGGHTGSVFWAAFSPDGSFFASAGADGTARLWETDSGLELHQFLGHTDAVSWLDFSPDGRYLVTASSDRTARVWDVQTGAELRRFVGHTDVVLTASFSPDGSLVATASTDKTGRLWNVATGREVRQLLGHTSGVTMLSFSPDGKLLLSAGEDGSARLWDVERKTEPRRLITFAGTHNAAFQTASAISPDRRFALSDQGDGTVRLWNLATAALVWPLSLQGGATNDLAFSPDGSLALAVSSSGVAYIIPLLLDEEITTLPAHEGSAFVGVFSPDSRLALTGGEDGIASLWDVKTGKEIRQFAGHTGPVRSAAFSIDGRRILTGGDDQTMVLWQSDTSAEIRRFGGQIGAVHAVAFSPDGRSVISGHEDHSAVLWETSTGRVLQRFAAHTGRVSQVVFAPDGNRVLTASADQTAGLWDVRTGQLLHLYSGHESPLLEAGFSDDGESIYTADRGNVYVWRTELSDMIAFACEELSRDFTAEERAFYSIRDNGPTCPHLEAQVAMAEPTWTPFVPEMIQVAPLSLVVEMEFSSEAVNITMGVPIQEVFIDVGNGQVARPWQLDDESMAMPVYSSAVEVPLDFLREPFDDGPYPKGDPLGFTLGDYVAATGRGRYIIQGNRALVELTFDNLVPNGVYTMWCNVLSFTELEIEEYPCISPDGTPYSFVADAVGHAELTMDISAFPPSTDEAVYEIAIAYHSDGKTHGNSVGEHGKNAHGQLFYDFLPSGQ